MNKKETNFVKNISSGNTKKLLLKSIHRFIKNIEWKEIILELKNKHSFQKLQKTSFFSEIKQKIQKIYGEDFSLSLKLKPILTLHDREMNIPHTIHYR